MVTIPFTGFFDACAGIGCFHSGIVNSVPETEFKCVGMAEIETHLRNLYLVNFNKEIPDFGSVHLLSGTVKPSNDEEERELERWKSLEIPKGTILTAGFPCQPFSKSGEQLGVRDGMRGTVFDSLVDMLNQKKFSGFIFENVENLSGPKHKEDFQLMLKVLKENYWVDYFIESPHNMDGDYSLQHRRRVFILGLFKNEFNKPVDRSFLSESDRRTHRRKKDCAYIIFDQLSNPGEAKEQYTSSGGTITTKLLKKIATSLISAEQEDIDSMKKQELLEYLIQYKGGKYNDKMISTGSTITASGWNEIVDLYFPDKKSEIPKLGFVERMKILRDKKQVYPNENNFKALEIWNEFLQKLPIEQEPCSPVWSMEFDKKYELTDLERPGKTIEQIRGQNPDEELPPYILSMFSNGILKEPLPGWKKDFITKNRKFYQNNKQYLADWLRKIRSEPDKINNTLQKFEWQCEPSTWDQMVNEIKKTFKILGWNYENLDRKTISERSKFCSIISPNLKLESGQGSLISILKTLNSELASDQEKQINLLLSKSERNFTIKGLRIINRLLRKHKGVNPRTMEGNVVQFRPSGIRFSDSETSPALVAIGQIPYLVESLSKDGVYQLSTKQAAYLQGIDVEHENFKSFKKMFSSEASQIPIPEQFKRLGNAVNVELVKRIMYQFGSVAKDLKI